MFFVKHIYNSRSRINLQKNMTSTTKIYKLLINPSADEVKAPAIQQCNKTRGHLKLFHHFFNNADILKY